MNVLCVPDLHSPFLHEHAIDFLSDLRKQYKPDRVVCLGDEIDAQSMSRFVRNPDLDNPASEITRARKALSPLYKLFPEVRLCNSNHKDRPYKRAAEAGLPSIFLKSIRGVLGAPRGWVWADSWTFHQVYFCHGEGFSGDQACLKAALAHRRNTVIGHVHHTGGVLHSAGQFDTLWGLSVGCLIDQDALAFSYGKHMPKRPVLGAGVIVDGVPHFIPLKSKASSARGKSDSEE